MKGDIITDITEVERIVGDYYKQLYANKVQVYPAIQKQSISMKSLMIQMT